MTLVLLREHRVSNISACTNSVVSSGVFHCQSPLVECDCLVLLFSLFLFVFIFALGFWSLFFVCLCCCLLVQLVATVEVRRRHSPVPVVILVVCVWQQQPSHLAPSVLLPFPAHRCCHSNWLLAATKFLVCVGTPPISHCGHLLTLGKLVILWLPLLVMSFISSLAS